MKYMKIILATLLLSACRATLTPALTPNLTPMPILTPTPTPTPLPPVFNAERAYEDVRHQLSFGPRTPSSTGLAHMREWLVAELELCGWDVEVQEDVQMGHQIFNIVARRGGIGPKDDAPLLLGAHYDTRLYADNDPDPSERENPVPGANDGASGVAVLLELARILPPDLDESVWLVFFDAEDNGRIEGWDWILGSRAFVENLEVSPRAVVIVDMIGDADLNIYRERNSSPALMDEIWGKAAELGYDDYFISEPGYSMLDDHTPFLQAGIPAVDIIDFDYQYWHTVEDTLDKVSVQSLRVVGDTLLAWLMGE